jgi:hypothetical protein
MPLQAIEHEGSEQTVEFKVRSFSGTTYLELDSDVNAGAPESFAVRITADYFKSPTDREKVQRDFAGKTIRVRGKILRDPMNGLYIKVDSPEQIIPVGR